VAARFDGKRSVRLLLQRLQLAENPGSSKKSRVRDQSLEMGRMLQDQRSRQIACSRACQHWCVSTDFDSFETRAKELFLHFFLPARFLFGTNIVCRPGDSGHT
jgi:hypothetical protein